MHQAILIILLSRYATITPSHGDSFHFADQLREDSTFYDQIHLTMFP